jgi:CRP-like cAMP-binding protein
VIEFEKRKALIRQHPCFAALSEESIDGLAELCFENHYNSGDIIISEGEVVDSVYLIAQGEIEVDFKMNQVDHIPQAVLREGDAIGLNQEGFYSQTGLRTATLSAINEVMLVGWPLDIFHHFLETQTELRDSMKNAAEKMLRMNFIKQAAPFADLPAETVEKLAQEIEEIMIPEGDVLFEQGDEALQCYLVCSGEVEIFINQKDGTEKTVAHLQPWRLFGESALLSTAKRNAGARMSEAGRLLVLKREQLQELMSNHNTSESIMALIVEHARPTQAENIMHYHRENAEGQAIIILKDERLGHYYQLSEEGFFVWEQLDGQKNLQDITIALYKAKKIFAPDAVADTVLNLADAGFALLPEIHTAILNEPPEILTRWQRIKQKLHKWRYFQHIFYDIDPWVTASYQAGVRLFFTWFGQIVMAAVTLAGIIFFNLFLDNIATKIPAFHHLILLLILLFIANLLLTILHELAHGFTTKHFKQDVHRAGVIFTWLGLAAFVDTSDMWLSSRGRRIIVSLAGPYMDLFLAGIFAILAFSITQPAFALFFWLLSLTLYYSVFKNINPILENDGYYVMKDALNDPHLRYNSYAFLKKMNLKNGLMVLKEHRNERIYWLTCLFFFIIALLIAFAAQHYLRLVLPSDLFGISTWHLLWIMPGLVIVNYVLTISNFLRNL